MASYDYYDAMAREFFHGRVEDKGDAADLSALLRSVADEARAEGAKEERARIRGKLCIAVPIGTAFSEAVAIVIAAIDDTRTT